MKTLSSLPLCAALVSVVFGVTPAFAQQLVHVAPFDRIELEGGGHVIVKRGDVQQVRLLEGSLAFTRFTVDEPRKLRIEACKHDCPRHYDLEVEITTPRIEGLAVSGGGAIDSAGNFPPPRNLALAVDGGGTIDARAVDADKATAAARFAIGAIRASPRPSTAAAKSNAAIEKVVMARRGRNRDRGHPVHARVARE